MKQLNISKWHHKILHAPVYFLEIAGFTKEQDLVAEYIDRREIETHSGNQVTKEKVSDSSDAFKKVFVELVEKDLQKSS